MAPRSSFLAAALVLAGVLACANPLSRFSKQYKCQIPGRQDPATAYQFVERGMEHVRANQLDCALGACSEAIRLDPKLAAGYLCRSGILNGNEDYAAALKDINQALRLEPQNGDFYYSRAQTYERQGKTELAMEDLTKAIEFITSGFGRSLAYATRGSLRGKQGQWDQAVQDYNEAIRIAPEFAYHYEHRGDCYYEKSDYERAVADYSDAIRLEPQNKHFYEDRAKVYRKLGNIELANIDEAKSQAPIAQ